MHDNLQFAATLIAILGGIVFSRRDARRLEAKIDAKTDKIDAKIDAKTDKIDTKIDALRSDIRGDMSVLDGIVYDHHGRITKLEAKQEGKP